MSGRDDEVPARLASQGTRFEREVMHSALEDVPPRGLRDKTLGQVLAAGRDERRARWAYRFLGVAAALALAGALTVAGRVDEPALPAPEPIAAVKAKSEPKLIVEPAFEPCTPIARAEGNQPLIDDFEDGDNRIPLLERRAGSFMTFNDGTATQAPLGANFKAFRIPGGRGTSRYALHTRGGKFTDWGAVLSIELNPRRCYDAGAYSGIQFWAKGRGAIQVVLKMTQVVAEEFGGSCKANCFDNHQHTVALTREFELHEVRWRDLAQLGFGAPVPFDARSLLALEFSVLPEQTPFDFWIDDVSFIKE